MGYIKRERDRKREGGLKSLIERKRERERVREMVTERLFSLDFHTQNNARTLKPSSPTLIDTHICTHTHTHTRSLYLSLSQTHTHTQTNVLTLTHIRKKEHTHTLSFSRNF